MSDGYILGIGIALSTLFVIGMVVQDLIERVKRLEDKIEDLK